MSDTALSNVIVMVAILLALVVAFRVGMTRAAAGKIVAFIGLFILPVLAATQGFNQHMEKATTTQFCLSCHVMESHGRSLYVDDPNFVPAVHFQSHLVPADQACFTCHTTYTMFGDMEAKLRGLRHLYVQYLGTVPQEADVKLYTPYDNRECLHCHQGMRKFGEQPAHQDMPQFLEQIEANEVSCLDCHASIHDIGNLAARG